MRPDARDRPDRHPSWHDLTERQREAINEVWNDMVIPALKEVAAANKRRDDAIMEAQEAGYEAAVARRVADARAERERSERQKLLAEIATLRTRVLELEQGIDLGEAA